VPNSGKPEFGWERDGVRGFDLSLQCDLRSDRADP
jgi:hypothetical protein